MKRAALLALLVAASGVVTPVAQAVTGSVTATCTDGDFSGTFKLSYDRGTEYRLKRGTGAAGPYIADTGAMRVKVFHSQGTTLTAVLSRSKSGLRSGETAEVPVDGTTVERTGRAWVEVMFADRSGTKCTAQKSLR